MHGDRWSAQILEHFGDLQIYRDMEGALGNGLTLHEAIAAEIGTVTLPLEQAPRLGA